MKRARGKRSQREIDLLYKLIELYLSTGRAVGSQTLKSYGFQKISSATIRNDFSRLETLGFLMQEHSSSGRIPTQKGLQKYAADHLHLDFFDQEQFDFFKKIIDEDTKEMGKYLERAATVLSEHLESAVFLSAPRFDADFVQKIRLVEIDSARCLGVIVTNFGLVYSETFSLDRPLQKFALKRAEHYCNCRLTGAAPPPCTKDEASVFHDLYTELMTRHLVGYTNFQRYDLYKTGFSTLLRFPEFQNPEFFAQLLALFEDTSYVGSLLDRCMKRQELSIWIGDELEQNYGENPHNSVIAIPYHIQGKVVGAIACVGPVRGPYPKIFATLTNFATVLSRVVTRNLSRYKITYRQPEVGGGYLAMDSIYTLSYQETSVKKQIDEIPVNSKRRKP